MPKILELIKELCPNGVEYVTFAELCAYIRGITYNKAQETNSTKNSWKVLRANNISVGTNTLNFNEVKTVSCAVPIKKEQFLKKGDILICAGSGSKEHIGKVAYIDEDLDFTCGGFMAIVRCDEKRLNSKFLFHYLTGNSFSKYLEVHINNTTINNLNYGVIKDLQIPLPPLAAQCEIVRILDYFTELTAELTTKLTAELTARRKQYEFYRDKLLSFDNSKIKHIKIKEIAEIGTGSSNTNEELSIGKYPFFVRSQEIRWKDSYEFDETAIITSGDGVGVGKIFHYISGKYALHQRAYRIHVCIDEVLPKFLYYYMKSYFLSYIQKSAVNSSVTSIRRPMLENFTIPIPPLEVQEKIVAILDKFDKLCNDLSEGLPAEIEKRQKQYEYYRDKLLSFKEKVV